MECGKLIKTIDCIMPCKRDSGHTLGCNPFSNTEPQVSKSGDVEPKVSDTSLLVKHEILPPESGFNAEHKSEKKVKRSCLWVNGSGKSCILELGHFPTTPHQSFRNTRIMIMRFLCQLKRRHKEKK